jgi:hypothetical protein
MNGLHDLLEKLKKLEEAEAAPTAFTANYFHQNNFGGRTQLMMTTPGVFWHMASATNDDGGTVRGAGGKTIQRWYGNTESRDALSPASVDGKIVDGKYYEFPEGTTWKTDLASLAQTRQTVDATKASLAAPNKEYDAAVASLKEPFKGAKLTQLPKDTAAPAPAPAAPAGTSTGTAAGSAAAPMTSQFPASPTAPATAGTVKPYENDLPAGLADRNAKIKDLTDLLAKYPTLKEFAFKSSIGRALLESFDLKLDEKVTIGATAGNTTQYTTPSGATYYASAELTKEEATKRINDLVFYFKDPKFKDDKEVQDLITRALTTINTPADDSGAPPVTTSSVKADDSGAPPVASASAAAPAHPGTNWSKVKPQGAKVGRENPGTRAYQNWLNAHGVNVEVDGKYGEETQNAGAKLPKEYQPASTDKAKRTEYEDMLGVGTAYNVIPGQGLSLNSPEYLEKMKKYGYDPKTGEKIGGAPAAPASAAVAPAAAASKPAAPASAAPASAAPASAAVAPAAAASKPAAPATTLSTPAAPAVSSGAQKVDTNPGAGLEKNSKEAFGFLRKTITDPQEDESYWVNGVRYTYGRHGQRVGWQEDTPWFNANRTTQQRERTKYTGPENLAGKKAEPEDSAAKPEKKKKTYRGLDGKVHTYYDESVNESGFANEELSRIISLIHYR